MYHSFCNLQFQTQKNGLNEQFTEKTTAPNEPWFSVSISTKRELIGRGRRSRRPVISNEWHEITKQPVILSAVELLRVERKRTSKSASRKAKRDLVWSLGGILMGCNICLGKPPKFVRRSLRRYRSSVFPRSSLRKTSTTLRMTYSGIFCFNLKDVL